MFIIKSESSSVLLVFLILLFSSSERDSSLLGFSLSADTVRDYLRKAEVIRLPPPARLLSEGIKHRASDLVLFYIWLPS